MLRNQGYNWVLRRDYEQKTLASTESDHRSNLLSIVHPNSPGYPHCTQIIQGIEPESLCTKPCAQSPAFGSSSESCCRLLYSSLMMCDSPLGIAPPGLEPSPVVSMSNGTLIMLVEVSQHTDSFLTCMPSGGSRLGYPMQLITPQCLARSWQGSPPPAKEPSIPVRRLPQNMWPGLLCAKRAQNQML